jgi:hypothetical protein
MLIALLAVLGVNLIVVVALLAVVLARRRWVSQRPGAFTGAIRVVSGEHDGLGSKWRRGYGRWVRDVLVWTKKPLLFRNELMAVDGLHAARPATDGEIKRMGDAPTMIELVVGDAVIQIAARGNDQQLVLGPLPDPGARDAVGGVTPAASRGFSEAEGRAGLVASAARESGDRKGHHIILPR